MKNKFIILILIMFISSINANAADFYPELGMDPFYSSLNPTYIPENTENQDSVLDLIKNKKNNKKEKNATQKTLEQNEEQNTTPVNNFIEPDKEVIEEIPAAEIKEEEKEDKSNKEVFVRPKNIKELEDKEETNTSFRDKLPFFKKKQEKKEETIVEDPKIELTADYMEYYPDRYEVEAVGNAKLVFTKEKTTLSAHKMVFNYDKNIVKANENVVLIASDSITEGDFIKLDLNKPDGWIDNPVTKTDDIKLSAKEAFIYSDRIEEYEGVAKVLKNDVLAFRAHSFANYVDKSGVLAGDYGKKKKTNSGIYTLKANTIYIDSRKDHEVITIKNADLYLKKYKLAAIPSTRIVSNKQNTVIESNIPEIGSHSLLGVHAGPAVVLNVPGGSTLKLAPIVTYSKEKLGIGGIARFRNQYNMTEVAYGTSRDELLIRGRQKLAPGLTLHYSRLTNESEWFLGYRKPKYSANLIYSKNNYVDDLKLYFSQQYSAGVFVDNVPNAEFRDAEGRFRWMTQSFKPVYSYRNEEGNIGFSTGLVAQTAASVYTSGDVLGLFRIGPALNTQVGPWSQALMYLQTASAGESPFWFDRYRYGHSNVILIESLKLCKYLSVGYMASIAMNREVKDDDLFQENRFLVSFGPEYARITIGYDALRQNTMLIMSMLVGTKDSEIAFKKSILKNPEKFGKENKKTKKNPKKKNYKKYLKEEV